SGGHRRYNEDDIERVELMKRLVAEGVPAEAAAAVATSMEHLDLEAALTAPEPHTSSVRDTHPPSAVAPVMVASIVRAAVDLDARSLDTCYDQTLGDRGVLEGWDSIIVPALRAISERWEDGSRSLEAEHLACHRLAAALRGVTASYAADKSVATSRPALLCGTDHDLHGLPLLALEAELARSGVLAHCIGTASARGESIIAALQHTDPSVVFVWASNQVPDDHPIHSPLLSVKVPVLLGGPGWPEHGVPGLGGAGHAGDLRTSVVRVAEHVRDGALP